MVNPIGKWWFYDFWMVNPEMASSMLPQLGIFMAFLLGIQAIIEGFRWFCLIVPAGTEINRRSQDSWGPLTSKRTKPSTWHGKSLTFFRLIMTYR